MEGVEGETRRCISTSCGEGEGLYYPRMRLNSVQYRQIKTQKPFRGKTDAKSHSKTRNKTLVECFVHPDLIYDGEERIVFFRNVLLTSIALLLWCSITAAVTSQATVIYRTCFFRGCN